MVVAAIRRRGRQTRNAIGACVPRLPHGAGSLRITGDPSAPTGVSPGAGSPGAAPARGLTEREDDMGTRPATPRLAVYLALLATLAVAVIAGRSSAQPP